ncbi:MAG: hypothetical protein E4H36_01970 [Spirochaetales bacterium]|nr:MAG: hypothetical protein E4H36_01970 [Spirochaetales bacterium]
MKRLKVGVLFVTSNWFRQVGVQEEGGSLSAEVETIGREAVDRIAAFADTVYDGVLYSEQSARAAARNILKQNVRVLVVSSLMWCEDQVLRAALSELPDLPVILFTLIPSRDLPPFLSYTRMLKGSGTVGSLQFSGMLRREGRQYISLTGFYGDEGLYNSLGIHLKALELKEKLKSLKVGVLPFPCSQMSTTYVDEFALRAAYGVELRYLELARLKSLAEKVTLPEAAEFRRRIDASGIRVSVEEEELDWAIRSSLGLQKLSEAENISVMAMNDVTAEMHAALGLRPSLFNPDFSGGDAVVSMEADIAAGIGLYLLKQLSGKPALYTEVLGLDIAENSLLLGHAGYHDAALADSSVPVKIVHDVEYKTSDRYKGACTCFKMRPGPVTLVNSVFHEKRFKWTAVSGESLPGPEKLEDTAHLMFRPVISVSSLIDCAVESGVSQHWLALPGDYLEELRILACWLPADLTVLS